MDDVIQKVLRAAPYSPMNFMPEQFIFDRDIGNNVRFRSMFEMPSWEGVEADETTYIVEDPDERIDKIAARFWGVERMLLGWVIAARNNLDLPDVQLYKGLRLRIPSRAWIDQKLMPQATKGFGR